MINTKEELKTRIANVETFVQEWFAEHPDVRAVYAKELGEYMQEKKVISPNANPQNALVYSLKRSWERNELAAIVPSARLYGSKWIFARTEHDEPLPKENLRMAAMRKFNLSEEETYLR